MLGAQTQGTNEESVVQEYEDRQGEPVEDVGRGAAPALRLVRMVAFLWLLAADRDDAEDGVDDEGGHRVRQQDTARGAALRAPPEAEDADHHHPEVAA
jgi:hypothetical protein